MGRTSTTPSRQRGGVILWTILAIFLVAGAYYGYRAIVFYRTNVAPTVEQVSKAVGVVKQVMPSYTVTRDQGEIATALRSILRIAPPEGYKGAFAFAMQMLGKSSELVALVPQGVEASQVFEGGTNEIRFNPGRHTIFIVAKSADSDREQMRAEIAKMVAGGGTSTPPEPLFIEAGGRRVAAYVSTGQAYGALNKGVLVFLDGGRLAYAVGPADGFDDDALRRFLEAIVLVHPANELLYSHPKLAPVAAASNDPCGIGGLPDDFDVVAVSVYKGSIPLDISIDKSGSDVAREEVVVGATPKPVVLVLMGYDPIVWNVGSTADANIAGILAVGAHRQAVMGVPKSIPVTAYSGSDGPNACRYFRAQAANDPAAAKRIRELFGRDISVFMDRKGGPRFVVGDAAGEPVHSQDVTLASIALPADVMPGGKRGLERLMKEKAIRPATEEEVQAWVAGAAKRKGKPAAEYRREMESRFWPHGVLVVQREFDLPEGLAGADARTFLIPEGAPRPGGPQGHCTFLAMENFQCYGTMCR